GRRELRRLAEDDVRVRRDVALPVEDEARAEAALARVALLVRVEQRDDRDDARAELLVDRLGVEAALLADVLDDVDTRALDSPRAGAGRAVAALVVVRQRAAARDQREPREDCRERGSGHAAPAGCGSRTGEAAPGSSSANVVWPDPESSRIRPFIRSASSL